MADPIQTKTILVLGATGKQGGSVIKHLTGNTSFQLLALTRNPASPTASRLSDIANVTVVQGDLDNPDSIRKLFSHQKDLGLPIWGVFSVLEYPGLGASTAGEEAQGKLIAGIAQEFEVSCFVYSSAQRGGEVSDDLLIAEGNGAKVQIERHIRSLDLPWIIIRPGFFMENYEGLVGRITIAVLRAGLQPTTTIKHLAVNDVGQVSAGIFENHTQYLHEILLVVGDDCTFSELDAAYASATNQAFRTVPSIPLVFGRLLLGMNKDLQKLVATYERQKRVRQEGKCPEEDHQTVLAKKAIGPSGMTTFEAWVYRRNENKPANVDLNKRWNRVSLWKIMTGQQ